MNKTIIFILIFGLAVVYGCSFQLTFEKGVKKMDKLDNQYGASLKSPPDNADKITGLVAGLNDFKAANPDIPDSLALLIDFRVKFLESAKLDLEGWQWGKASTTDYGFGCSKGYPRITESAKLRNASAQKGNEAVAILQEFVDRYQAEAQSLNISQKDVLILKTEYFTMEEKAARDARIMRSLCKDQANQTG
ncbi:hypothetical protein HYU09_00875 [Candidatus Woesearchaeota archaeon]|nr:hypothetical protein [Candidatus Woesearchaeota archaeon]